MRFSSHLFRFLPFGGDRVGVRERCLGLLLLLSLGACTQVSTPIGATSPSLPHASADSDVAREIEAVETIEVVEGEPLTPTLQDEALLPAPTREREPRPSLPSALYPDQALAPFVELGAMDSLPGESLEDFLVRVSQAIDVFTVQTSHEACGVLMSHIQEDAWRVRLTTNRSHLSCTLILFYEPGFERLGPDIHSHPFLPDGAIANAQDVLRNPRFTCGQRIKIFDERFSSQDLERGPGYLVSRGRLLYQEGGPIAGEEVATFQRLEEAPELALSQGLSWGEMGTHAAAAAAWANEDAQDISEDWFPSTRCPDETLASTVSASKAQDP